MTPPTKVVSEYFKETKKPMDESLSDFQESKKKFKLPIAVAAPKAFKGTKSRTKKPLKKIKGQKNIESILKSNSNELVKYSREFDIVCQEAGIDVDSEQLQLAIALSKSLQNADNVEGELRSTSLSNQKRSVKIRATLQEYGFTVPEVKVKKIVKNRLKQYKEKSKLLLITEEERQQITVDRYSQVLINCISNQTTYVSHQNNSNPLYYFATNISYDSLRNDDIFYIQNLIEKNVYTMGCLLKDWSQIPGRPLSPVLVNQNNFEVCDFSLSTEELNKVLSGSLELAQHILNNKMKAFQISNTELVLPAKFSKELPLKVPTNEDKFKDINMKNQIVRSASPDLFDDDYSSANDVTNAILTNTRSLSQKISNSNISIITLHSEADNRTKLNINDTMDLTECIKSSSQPLSSMSEMNSCIEKLNFSSKSNTVKSKTSIFTQRRSDDFMEITNCVDVPTPHIPIVIKDNIDLTQHTDEEEEKTIIVDCDISCKSPDLEISVLTRSPDSGEDTLPLVSVNGHKKAELGVYCRKSASPYHSVCYTNENNSFPDVVEHLSGVLKGIDSATSKNSIVFDEFNFNHSDGSVDGDSKNQAKSLHNVPNIDLSQSSDSCDEIQIVENINLTIRDTNNLGKQDDVSIDYDEVIIKESSQGNIVKTDSSCMALVKNDVVATFQTQVTRSHMCALPSFENSVVENENVKSSNTNIGNNAENSMLESQSDIFQISDEELNYSVRHSKHAVDVSQDFQQSKEYEYENPNFDFGGISLMDNISNLCVDKNGIYSLRFSNGSLPKSVNDSLPVVEIKGTKLNTKSPSHICKTEISSPLKQVKEEVSLVNTPNQSKYILKTNQVTPMLDYASMSTPERNSELNKYGLKPFKRKRAIQLLTHVYNQTHPVLEILSNDELPSQSKRRKQETKPDGSPIKGSQSNNSIILTPKKQISKSPRNLASKNSTETSSNLQQGDKENNMYEVTNERPYIKEVDCTPDDWVFQKRDKAKVQSCRLPLHIAFHNYVSSRRELREAILRYEPVNIDVIHKDLVGYGHRYDPKDLLKFLDKKCITVKTVDNSARNVRK